MSLAPSSPRLPSPPPAAEIQIGPKSPSMNNSATQQAQQREQTALDANAKRRVHAGTKASDMAAGPPLMPLNELDSAFQLQEHLAALHYYHTSSSTQPITRETALTLASPPAATDRTLWLYELCRFLISQCNGLIVGFLFDTPPCSAATCPEMRASEWQFLCAVHESPKSCCAIDYCCHTLDWAANVVTNPKIFPSRFVAPAGGDGPHDRGAAHKSLTNVFRRLHRIFAHAWFQHRGVFWSVEAQTGLYVFFKTVCDLYDLLPAENYKLPPEAEGLEPAGGNVVSNGGAPDASSEDKKPQLQQQQHAPGGVPISILRPPHQQQQQKQRADGGGGSSSSSEEENFQPVGRTATRRHVRSSPSTGSAVTTVPEADEDESSAAAAAAAVAKKLRDMHISPPETVEEEGEGDGAEGQPDGGGGGGGGGAGGEEGPESADVPVIVMHSSLDSITPQAMKPEDALPVQHSSSASSSSPPPGPQGDHLATEARGAGEAAAPAAPAVERSASPSEPMTAFPNDDAPSDGSGGGAGGVADTQESDDKPVAENVDAEDKAHKSGSDNASLSKESAPAATE